MRDIEILTCSEEFNIANFGVIYYRDSMNREQRAYEMTKDRFSFLVMGVPGITLLKINSTVESDFLTLCGGKVFDASNIFNYYFYIIYIYY